MDQLIKQESQKIVAKQMRQARIQRQIQVRQQTIAWTETKRKKFEDAKEREIKNLASAVTEDARNAAVRNIEYLTKLNDLAMADIGMAHRAAAGNSNVERLKSLKRVKDKEVAKNRGALAMIKEKQSKTVVNEIFKRREQVRKAEDKRSKALIMKPVSTSFIPSSGSGTKSPKLKSALAKTLRVASETQKKAVSTTSSEKLKEIKKGALSKMVRIKTAVTENDNVISALENVVPAVPSPAHSAVVNPRTSTVRYLNLAIPKGEVVYTAPDGLAVKEGINSPDAWEKAKETLGKGERPAEKMNESIQRAKERGLLAMKRAKIEKEITAITNDLLGDADEFSAVESDEEYEFPEIERQITKLVPANTKSSDSMFENTFFKEKTSSQTLKKYTFRQSKDQNRKSTLTLSPKDHSQELIDKTRSSETAILEKVNIAPDGLAVKDRINSPDVWEKAKEKLEKGERPAEKTNESIQRTEKRGLDMKRAEIEKEITAISNDLPRDIDDDEFSAVGSDEEYEFPEIQGQITKLVSANTKSSESIVENNFFKETSPQTTTKSTFRQSKDQNRKSTPPVSHKDHSQELIDETHSSETSILEKLVASMVSQRNNLSSPLPSSVNHSNSSDEIVILKATESNYSATSETETSRSTDYYIPPTPEGPFTSTPDGKLHPKRFSSDSDDHSISEESMELLKRRTLYHYVSKFLTHRPESIEKLPVSTSASSVIRADSDVLLSESYEDTFGEFTQDNENSSIKSKKSMPNSSHTTSSHVYNVSNLPTVSEEDSEMESGSTIAEAAIKAKVTNAETTSTNDSSATNGSSGNSAELASSDSLSSMLNILSRHQMTEKRQVELESDYEQVSQVDLRDNSSLNGTQLNHGDSSGNSGEIPDVSLLLRQLLSRNRQAPSSSSSGKSSPKSGPEKEADRVQLLDDVTPVKLWDTPPQRQVHNQIEELSAVFEKLKAKWSNTRIDPPPWCDTLNSS